MHWHLPQTHHLKMNNTVLIPETCLHALNAFDVGHNPEHVNMGLMKHKLSNLVTQHLHQLEHSQAITFSGYALDLLDEESPELLESLVTLVQEHNIQLIGALYYNTTLSLLDKESFLTQWNNTQSLLQTFFGQTTNKLYIGAQPIPKHLSETLRELNLDIIGQNTLNINSVLLGQQHHKEIALDVGAHSPLHYQQTQAPLQEHITTELQNIVPYLKDDEQLFTTWQLLGAHDVVEQLNGHEPQQTYDAYFSLMNILNDVAHTIRNIELTKRGEFEQMAQIVDQPTQRILEVLAPPSDEVNHYA